MAWDFHNKSAGKDILRKVPYASKQERSQELILKSDINLFSVFYLTRQWVLAVEAFNKINQAMEQCAKDFISNPNFIPNKMIQVLASLYFHSANFSNE